MSFAEDLEQYAELIEQTDRISVRYASYLWDEADTPATGIILADLDIDPLLASSVEEHLSAIFNS